MLRVRRFVISDLTESSSAYAARCVHCFEPGPVFSPEVPVLKSRVADLQDPPPVLFPAPTPRSVFDVPVVMVIPFLFVDPLTFLRIIFPEGKILPASSVASRCSVLTVKTWGFHLFSYTRQGSAIQGKKNCMSGLGRIPDQKIRVQLPFYRSADYANIALERASRVSRSLFLFPAYILAQIDSSFFVNFTQSS